MLVPTEDLYGRLSIPSVKARRRRPDDRATSTPSMRSEFWTRKAHLDYGPGPFRFADGLKQAGRAACKISRPIGRLEDLSITRELHLADIKIMDGVEPPVRTSNIESGALGDDAAVLDNSSGEGPRPLRVDVASMAWGSSRRLGDGLICALQVTRRGAYQGRPRPPQRATGTGLG